MQNYSINPTSTPSEVKKISFYRFTASGKRKEIKKQILHYLQFHDLTARELSEYIRCMRSSVCNALNELCKNQIVSDYKTKFDDKTNRNVTLYSLIKKNEGTC